ncbi:MAG: hypothetical protein A2X13_01390 [Bacteroidetes bacterium GWC2_33_15]|nr:MAG: hypothetical protein A2X10_08235 [Bacteroidetes bacterium GWA2_33_15]OFX52138.1 MAG: hypothetical protein A2X13_01390 [Bacteroidetes bacterium GWC2_33_15]OFX64292.1 MAG: hypothetical protein A2X15_12210 [Bacteroidetes bacterium GWB2_32_14]OFX67697.1 MAG: hypothetical protein A2X14_06035 [Bacteroidetes bacterium GWD2_33_33]HAN19305.1 TonB-dependent receptor [Bacteroidales bacterium]
MKKLTIFLAFLLFVGFTVQAQMQISGTVTSAEDGLSIPGVSVVVKDNITIGTTTDIDGKYSLTIPSSAQSLVFTFVGMKAAEIAINGRSVIDLMMEAEVLEMDEVVVVAYGTAKKASFTGSASVVKTEKLEAKPVASFDQALQGNVAGLQISSGSGQPGSATSVRIRGTGSISAGNEPLYVIDGVPVISGDIADNTRPNDNRPSVSAMASLNPDDIASISVLKDAAATSIYGSRASNGVVLITTKQGKEGETQFMLKTQYGISTLGTYNYEALNADEYREMKYRGTSNALVLAGVEEEAANAAAYAEMMSLGDANVDWIDEAFRTGTTQKIALEATGGTEKTKFFSSLSYFDQEGIVLGSFMKRYAGRLNLDHKASDRISFGANVTGSFIDQDNVSGGGYYNDPVTGAYFIAPTTPIYNEDGSFNSIIPENLNNNLVANNEWNTNLSNTSRVIANGYGQFSIIENLNWRTALGVDYLELEEDDYLSPLSNDGATYNGLGQKYYTRNSNWIITNTLNYSKVIADVHDFNILLGQEAQDFFLSTADLSAKEYPSEKLQTLQNAAEPLTASTFETANSLASYFGRLEYNYSGKYYLSGSYRRDGSSKFGANNKWANFWSVGGSWRISEESFISNIEMINNLTLRASYGTSGNQSGISNFAALGLYGFGSDYNTKPGSAPAQIANPDLQWEKAKNLNIGLDFRIYDMFSATIGWYNNITSDLLQLVPISRTTGFESQWRNIGEMQNTGWEFELTADIIKGKDLKWFIEGNIAYNKNEILSLSEGEDIVSYPFIRREGESFGSFWAPKWAGVNPANGMPLWYDEDGNIVDTYAEADYQIVGKSDPDFMGGLTSTWSYKGINLSVFFNFVQGNDIYNNSGRYLTGDGAAVGNQDRRVLTAWETPGEYTEYPQFVTGNASNSNRFSSRFIEDGSYVRLKSVILSYDLPKAIVSKAKLSSVRIFAQGENLYTWTDYSGFDPELAVDGQAWFSYPQARTITFGINFGF